MAKKKRRQFTDEFKKQMVNLVKTVKNRADITREYELSPSVLNRWIKQSKETSSFKEKDNRTNEQNEIIKLIKELELVKIENDILKQAAHNFFYRKTFYERPYLQVTSDIRTKVNLIKTNSQRYCISAMCKVLEIPRSTYYFFLNCPEKQKNDKQLRVEIKEIFRQSRNNYGTRKIKFELKKKNIINKSSDSSSILSILSTKKHNLLNRHFYL